jgi:hypothetical protein
MVTIIAISDSDKHFTNAINEYAQRMRGSMRLVNLPPV